MPVIVSGEGLGVRTEMRDTRCVIWDAISNRREDGRAMNLSFENKVVLIAGGTGGLGRAVSLAFLIEGATTVVTYR